jgi:hypothetical protein
LNLMLNSVLTESGKEAFARVQRKGVNAAKLAVAAPSPPRRPTR